MIQIWEKLKNWKYKLTFTSFFLENGWYKRNTTSINPQFNKKNNYHQGSWKTLLQVQLFSILFSFFLFMLPLFWLKLWTMLIEPISFFILSFYCWHQASLFFAEEWGRSKISKNIRGKEVLINGMGNPWSTICKALYISLIYILIIQRQKIKGWFFKESHFRYFDWKKFFVDLNQTNLNILKLAALIVTNHIHLLLLEKHTDDI